jgi:hypothetical protein
MFNLKDLFRPRVDFSAPRRSAKVLGDVVQDALAAHSLLNFQRVGDLSWVSQPEDHIRYHFGFQALKGLAYTGCWGVSIDFVPRVSGQGLTWKRTAKTAICDLTIDPVDTTGEVPRWCTFYAVEGDRQVAGAAQAAWKAAQSDFSRINGLADVVSLFEQRSAMRSRLLLETYNQTDIAWGLLLIALGRSDQGEQRLERFRQRFDIRRDTPVLLSAMKLAAEIAAKPLRPENL